MACIHINIYVLLWILVKIINLHIKGPLFLGHISSLTQFYSKLCICSWCFRNLKWKSLNTFNVRHFKYTLEPLKSKLHVPDLTFNVKHLIDLTEAKLKLNINRWTKYLDNSCSAEPTLPGMLTRCQAGLKARD